MADLVVFPGTGNLAHPAHYEYISKVFFQVPLFDARCLSDKNSLVLGGVLHIVGKSTPPVCIIVRQYSPRHHGG